MLDIKQKNNKIGDVNYEYIRKQKSNRNWR